MNDSELKKLDAVLKDLELQWKDHWHMRDQTWRTLTYSAAIFAGVIGLRFNAADELILMTGYIAVMIASFFGVIVAAHHRTRQGQKFSIISKYEELLELDEHKSEFLVERRPLLNKMFSVVFIVLVHACFGAIGLVLLVDELAT